MSVPLGKTFENMLFPNDSKGILAISHVKRLAPTVFACLARNKNGNLVVMEADEKQGVSFYWLDLEPSYREAARKAGKKHDRDEFGRLDHIAYGYTSRKLGTGFVVALKQLPHHEIIVRFVNGKSKAYVREKEKEYLLDFIYVNQTGMVSYEVDAYVIDENNGNTRRTIRANP